MKRMLAIITLCVLLLATVGTTAAVAEHKGKSSVYQFNVAATDQGSGKLKVNLDQRTYSFTGKGFVANERYWLQCPALGRTFGSVVANPAGNLNFQGTLPTFILATMPDAPASGYIVLTNSITEPLTASFTARYDHIYQNAATWGIDASSSTGPIYMYHLHCDYTDRSGNPAYDDVYAWEPDMAIQLSNIAYGTPVTATLYVTDTTDWSHTVASQPQPLPWP